MQKNIIIAVGIIVVIGGILFFIRNSAENTITDTVNHPTGDVDVITPGADAGGTADKKNINSVDNKKIMSATLHTNKGDITMEFYEKQAPNTVANFLKLAKSGFYDGVKFHRVIKGFMIQGGDPLSKDDSKMDMWGTGGPGYKFADEIDPQSDLYKTGYQKGIVAMANSGPNTNGSQFFIMTADYPLPPLYAIFGHVVAGEDVVDKIGIVQTGANDRPVDPVIINSISLK